MFSHVYGPQAVSNPRLIEDLRRYVYAELSEQQVDAILHRQSEDVKLKVGVILDRIEFVDHLMSLRRLLAARKRIVNQHQEGELVTCDEEIIFEGQEYNGVDYDIDAVCVYLLLTCIDVGGHGERHEEMGDWIIQQWKAAHGDENAIPIDYVKKAQGEYFEAHGVGRAFIKAITDKSSERWRSRLVQSLAIVRLDNGSITPESRAQWEKRTEADRVKRLARRLYEMRNGYTHDGRRSFPPLVPVARCPATKGDVLVALKPPDEGGLVELLKDLVVELLRTRLGDIPEGGHPE